MSTVPITDSDCLLLCPHCGKEYRIGIDAGIMTMEETIEMMRGMGTVIMGSLEPGPREDMLFSYEGSAPERLGHLQEQARQALGKVTQALAEGQERVWYCKECGVNAGTYPYPSSMRK